MRHGRIKVLPPLRLFFLLNKCPQSPRRNSSLLHQDCKEVAQCSFWNGLRRGAIPFAAGIHHYFLCEKQWCPISKILSLQYFLLKSKGASWALHLGDEMFNFRGSNISFFLVEGETLTLSFLEFLERWEVLGNHQHCSSEHVCSNLCQWPKLSFSDQSLGLF